MKTILLSVLLFVCNLQAAVIYGPILTGSSDFSSLTNATNLLVVSIATNPAANVVLTVHGVVQVNGTNQAAVLAVGNSTISQIKSNATGPLVLGNDHFYLDTSGHSHKAAGRIFYWSGAGATPSTIDSGTNAVTTGTWKATGFGEFNNGVWYPSNQITAAQVLGGMTNGGGWIGAISNGLYAVFMTNNVAYWNRITLNL